MQMRPVRALIIALGYVVVVGCDVPTSDSETLNGVESVRSAIVTTPVVGGARVACGGPVAVSPFLADTNSDGQGAIKTRPTAPIVTTGVSFAAPIDVYRSQRYQNIPGGTMTYHFTGLPPSMPVTVRLHFAETNTADNVVGARLFNVAINQSPVLTNFDLFATAGLNKAIVKTFTPTVDSQGTVSVTLTQVKDAATISGIEIFPAAATKMGTWKTMPVPSRYNGLKVAFAGGAQPQLLTDGSVLLGDASVDGTAWFRLTPDLAGNYETGIWTQVASSNLARQFFPSSILTNGNYLIAGGEDVVGDRNHSSVEVYDPVANSWSLRTTFPDTTGIGDTASSILPDGTWYTSSFFGGNTYTYNAANDLWQFAGPVGTGGSGDEKGWTLLQNGTLFDIFTNTAAMPVQTTWSQFVPNSGWTSAVNMPAGTFDLVSHFLSAEIGPASLLYDGRVLQFGSASDKTGLGIKAITAIFNPNDRSLVQGATPPDNLQWGDTSANTMVNGHVLNVTSTSIDSGYNVASVWEYDPFQPIDNAFTKVASRTAELGAANQLPNLAFPVFLQLPNGEVLDVDTNDSVLHVYVPDGLQTKVSPAWKPVITSIGAPSSGVFSLLGIQINGLTLGASFGDDRNSSTNFPIVWLRNTANGNVYYARTYGFASMTPEPAPTGHTCLFTLPAGIANGSYDVHLSANGVAASNTKPLTIAGVHVLWVSGSTVTSGSNATWTVKTSAAASTTQTITIAIDNPSVAQANVTSLTLPSGATSATFIVACKGPGIAHITAALAPGNPQFQPAVGTFGAIVQSVRPSTGIPRPDFLGPSPLPEAQTWTVEISNAVGSVVNLSSTAWSVVVPASVTIPPGKTSATFTVKRGHPPAGAQRPFLPPMTSIITASMNGSSKSYTVGVRARNDVNGDGLSDIVLTSSKAFSGIPVALSNGDGYFSYLGQAGETDGDVSLPVAATALGAKVVDGDFDDDGLADMAVIGSNATTIPAAFSKGDGSFHGTNTAVNEPKFEAAAMQAGVQPLTGDFNGDGSLDLALTGNPAWMDVAIAFSPMADSDRLDRRTRGTPIDGLFNYDLNAGKITSFPAGVNFMALASSLANDVQAVAGDFNGDGRTDIALVGPGSHIPVAFSDIGALGVQSFHVTNGSSSSVNESGFQGAQHIEGAQAIVGDFNGDGKSDIAIVAGVFTPGIYVAMANAAGDGSFNCSLNALSATSTDSNFAFYASQDGARLVAGDFDGDGFDDIAVTGSLGVNSIPVAFSNGDGTFRAVAMIGTQAQPFYDLAGMTGSAPTTTPPVDRTVDIGLAVDNAAMPCTVAGNAMTCCPVGMVMAGFDVYSNSLRCAPLMQPAGTITMDTTTRRNNMHSCPFGQVMVGLQSSLDLFACLTLPANPVTREDTDGLSRDQNGLQTCNSYSMPAMTGLSIGAELVNCAVDKK